MNQTNFAAPAEGLAAFSANELSRKIHSHAITCVEVMQAYLARIDLVNPTHNAIINLRDSEALLAEARAADVQLSAGQSKGWLHGIPFAIKDIAPVAGLPNTLGSPLLKNNVPAQDGLMASRIRAAGAVIIGKTNTPEFGLGSHSFNEVFGVTRNAFDPSKSAGGSSGGAAVALATSMLAVADGSDFMGSLRNPAAWNNIYGLRPSQGRVPMWPVADTWIAQLGTEGPMARNVTDLAMLLQTQAGFDVRSPLAIRGSSDFVSHLNDLSLRPKTDQRALRVGWLGNLNGYLPVEPGILEVCEKALTRMAAAGCEVKNINANFSPEKVWQCWLVWRQALVASRIAPYVQTPSRRAQVKVEAQWEHDQGVSLIGAQLSDASVARTEFYHQILAHFENCDFIAMPCTQVWPFAAELRWPQTINGLHMDTYHRWMEVVIYATLAGLPALSIPAGFGTPAGASRALPVGLQLIAGPQNDARLLQFARAYEREVSFC
jgi:amidase